MASEFLQTMVGEIEQGAPLAGFAHSADNAHGLVFADDADQIGIEPAIAVPTASMRRGQMCQHFRPQFGKILPEPSGLEDIDVGGDDAPFHQRRYGFTPFEHRQTSGTGHQDDRHLGKDRGNLPPAAIGLEPAGAGMHDAPDFPFAVIV